MVKDFVVTRSIMLRANAERVWEALTHPVMMKQYMFGCDIESQWSPGSPIIWRRTYEGQQIYRKGEIIKIVPGTLLKYTMFDTLADTADKQESYIHVTYEIVPKDGVNTKLLITLENFGGEDIRAEQAASIWDFEILPKLKSLIETTL